MREKDQFNSLNLCLEIYDNKGVRSSIYICVDIEKLFTLGVFYDLDNKLVYGDIENYNIVFFIKGFLIR